jgi:4-amino-4-deoxy-L-arabinose transferase-like glycosyltransferase
LLAVMALLIAERIFFFFWLPPIIEPDSRSYSMPAASIVNGPEFVNPVNRTPGYILFLAAVYKFSQSDRAVIFVQSVMGFLLILLIIKMLQSYAQKVLAGLFFFFNFSLLRYEHSILTDLLLVFLIVLIFYYLKVFFENQRGKDLLIASLLTGGALLTKPIMILYPALIVFILLLDVMAKREKVTVFFKRCLIFLLPVLTLWWSWSYFNFRHSKYFGLAPVIGMTLSVMMEDSINYDSGVQPEIKAIIKPHLAEKKDRRYNLISGLLPEIREKTGLTNIELNSRFMEIARETLRAHPFALLERALRETVYFWLTTDSVLSASSAELNEPGMLNNLKKGLWEKALAKFISNGYIFYYSMLLFFLAFWVMSFRKAFSAGIVAFPLNALIALSVLYVMFICSFLQYGDARYRLAVEPFMTVCAALALERLLRERMNLGKARA